MYMSLVSENLIPGNHGKVFKTNAKEPAEFDPRKYLGPAREALKELYKAKNLNVLGSANRVK